MRPLRDIVNYFARSIGTEAPNQENFIKLISEFDGVKNWSGEDTYWNILGRLPEESAFCGLYALPQQRANHIWDCLTSNELRLRFIERLTSIFPDRGKKLFIHVPRTAGTSIREHIEYRSNIVTWNFSLESLNDSSSYREWNHLGLSYEEFLLKFLIQVSDVEERPIILTGHASLGDVLNRNIISPHDECFAVVREPLEIVKSLIKYHFKIARDHAERDDGRLWRERIFAMAPEWNLDGDLSADMVHKMVRSQAFRQECSNIMVRSFSADADVGRAVENIAISKCKIFHLNDINTLSNHINEIFGINDIMCRKNESSLTNINLSIDDHDFITSELIPRDVEFIRELKSSGVICN